MKGEEVVCFVGSILPIYAIRTTVRLHVPLKDSCAEVIPAFFTTLPCNLNVSGAANVITPVKAIGV